MFIYFPRDHISLLVPYVALSLLIQIKSDQYVIFIVHMKNKNYKNWFFDTLKFNYSFSMTMKCNLNCLLSIWNEAFPCKVIWSKKTEEKTTTKIAFFEWKKEGLKKVCCCFLWPASLPA